MNLVLKVTPKFSGPASVGTVGLINLLRERLGLSLIVAKRIVDQCVFDGETVELPLPDWVDGPGLVETIDSLETEAAIEASITH